jgi:hypothetical protein
VLGFQKRQKQNKKRRLSAALLLYIPKKRWSYFVVSDLSDIEQLDEIISKLVALKTLPLLFILAAP